MADFYDLHDLHDLRGMNRRTGWGFFLFNSSLFILLLYIDHLIYPIDFHLTSTTPSQRVTES